MWLAHRCAMVGHIDASPSSDANLGGDANSIAIAIEIPAPTPMPPERGAFLKLWV
jgi:hypothetical protein